MSREQVVKFAVLALIVAALTGCGMEPEEIRVEADRCERMGFDAAMVVSLVNHEVVKVVCRPAAAMSEGEL